MLTFFSTCRRLPLLLLLTAVLLLPLNSFAQGLALGAQDSCACLNALPEAPFGGGDGNEPHPASGADECCDSEERSVDAAGPSLTDLTLSINPNLLFHPHQKKHFSTVYLSIFVPPEG